MYRAAIIDRRRIEVKSALTITAVLMLVALPAAAVNPLLSPVPISPELEQHLRQAPDGRLYLEIDDMLIPVATGEKSASYYTTWPGGVVYYQFHGSVDASDGYPLSGDGAARRAVFRAAAMEWQATVAGLTFIEGTGSGNYILVKSAGYNNSYVGMKGGAQDLNIYNWNWRFIVAHEIGHALSLMHEQSRPDRDTYLTVNYANIEDENEFNFDIWPGTASHGDYDYGSVMHYDRCGFWDPAAGSCGTHGYTMDAKAAGAALVGLTAAEANAAMGQRDDLSPGDIAGVRALYTPANTIFGTCFENGRTNAWSSTVSPCAHGLCYTGDPLNSQCDPCVATVCASDPWCCSTSWDDQCIDEAISWCDYSCP